VERNEYSESWKQHACFVIWVPLVPTYLQIRLKHAQLPIVWRQSLSFLFLLSEDISFAAYCFAHSTSKLESSGMCLKQMCRPTSLSLQAGRAIRTANKRCIGGHHLFRTVPSSLQGQLRPPWNPWASAADGRLLYVGPRGRAWPWLPRRGSASRFTLRLRAAGVWCSWCFLLHARAAGDRCCWCFLFHTRVARIWRSWCFVLFGGAVGNTC
jgi:hypothetical protein